jgi:hypothetical protein
MEKIILITLGIILVIAHFFPHDDDNDFNCNVLD